MTHKREERTKPSIKTTTILLNMETPATGPTTTPVATGKGRKYCPYCDSPKHSLNNSSNFGQLHTAQRQRWIKDNNRCGRTHRAADCDLKMFCKTCNKCHLLVLHEVNDRPISKGEINLTPTSHKLIPTPHGWGRKCCASTNPQGDLTFC